MNLCVLGSGSKGNSVLIWEPQQPGPNNQPWPLPWAILVDVGLSAAAITEHLKAFKMGPGDVKAILITHAHGDHVNGLLPFWKKCPNTVVFAHQATIDKISEKLKKGVKLPGEARPVEFSKGFWLSSEHKMFAAKGLPCEHNAEGAMAFIIRSFTGRRVALWTETGKISAEMWKEGSESHVICIEANHDATACLDNMDRPDRVNERTYVTHLNNDQAALAVQYLPDTVHTVVAMHISSDNNDPELVRRVLSEANSRRTKPIDAVILSSQEFATRVIEV